MLPQILSNLQDRAFMLKQVRDFFFTRKVMEVDCPIITKYASIDTHIDLMPVKWLEKETRYLHSSPEYGMKRLLSLKIGSIYQLSHVFRDEDRSHKHNPEFMMAEWYRINFSFFEMIDETCEFIQLFLGPLPIKKITYRDAFMKYAGFDYCKLSESDLFTYIQNNNIEAYPGIVEEGKDALLNLIMGTVIEKELGNNEILALYYYPASQAALAKTLDTNGEKVAERFEIYYKGLELANGYHELLNEEEQKKRLLEANESRIALNKNPLPLDVYFLQSLKKRIPDCSGVAVGFDRLMMLRLRETNIANVMPFGWDFA
jgi:lysyl-tRNA synthetase class 2